MQPYRLIAFDPGVKNFAFCVLDFKPFKKKKFRLITTGFLITPGTLDAPFYFLKSLKRLIKKHSPNGLVAERFMYRGASSVHSEQVNFWLGLVYAEAQRQTLPLMLPSASLWKRFYNWDSSKKKVLDTPFKVEFDTPHERDAAHLAYWYVTKGVFTHLTGLRKRLNVLHPSYQCSNCTYWLWEKARKNQTPCSKLGTLEKTDYCSDFNPIKLTRTPWLTVGERSLFNYFGWLDLKGKLKDKGFKVKRFYARSEKHKFSVVVKSSLKALKKFEEPQIQVTPAILISTPFQFGKFKLKW